MKNVIIILMLVTSIIGKAQNESNVPSVTVVGSVMYQNTVEKYRAKIFISLDQLYYSDESFCSLDELKTKFFDKLKEIGIDPSDLKEEKVSYELLGYQRPGALYLFESEKMEEIQKLTEVRVSGITVNSLEYRIPVGEVEREKLLKQSLKNAKEKASKLAELTEKKVGEIISVSDQSYEHEYWTSYYEKESYFTIQVTYELK